MAMLKVSHYHTSAWCPQAGEHTWEARKGVCGAGEVLSVASWIGGKLVRHSPKGWYMGS